MFHDIPQVILDRMSYLEEIDARDREDGTSRMKRLRQIPPITGRLIAMLASQAPKGNYIEIGTSAGYSTMWLGLACKQLGRKITTFEILKDKFALAEETFRLSEMTDVIELVRGNALDYIKEMDDISFCFLDAEKEIYQQAYDLVIPRLVMRGILVADNAINHRETLQPMIDNALEDRRVDAMVVPVGKGELICRKLDR